MSLAYQAFGAGDTDLVLAPGYISNLEANWEEPNYARFLERLASRFRVVLFDKRGTGLSDRIPAATLEERADDVRAVMDAAGVERAALLGWSEGGSYSAFFAAREPERVSHLILTRLRRASCGPTTTPRAGPWSCSRNPALGPRQLGNRRSRGLG